jgi:hypothetical protein
MASLHARRKLCDFAVKRVFFNWIFGGKLGILAGNSRIEFGGKILELKLAGNHEIRLLAGKLIN